MSASHWLFAVAWGLAAVSMPHVVAPTPGGNKKPPPAVTIDLHLVKTPAAIYRQIGAEERLAQGVATLNKFEMHCLLEAAQENGKTTIVQIPRVETISGRSVAIRNPQLECHILPEIAPDKGTIHLKITRTLPKEPVRVTIDAELAESLLLGAWPTAALEEGMSLLLIATPRVSAP